MFAVWRFLLPALIFNVKSESDKKIMRSLFMATLFLLVAACSSGNGVPAASGNERSLPPATVDDAPIVDNEDLTPGLKGIDSDGNGIRDDIDRFITRHYSATSIMQKVAEREARALQKSMEATTTAEAQAAGNAIFLAGDCTYKVLPHATGKDMKFAEDMSIEIKALTANTKERFAAYWHGESLAGGMVFRVNDDPACE